MLFSSSKGKKPDVWYSLIDERFGTFNGHNGFVWYIYVNWDMTRFMSGSGDNTLKVWDCQTAKEIDQLWTNSSVKTCNFSYSADLAIYCTHKALGRQCEMFIIDIRNVDGALSQEDAISRISVNVPRISALHETIIIGHEDGEIMLRNMRTRKKLKNVSSHKSQINDMQFNEYGTMFIISSNGNNAKFFDSEPLMLLKTYKTARPANSATISPIFDHVVLAGGQDDMDVTTTSTCQGKFDSRCYHLVFAEELTHLKRHFGQINSFVFHSNDPSFSTSGEVH